MREGSSFLAHVCSSTNMFAQRHGYHGDCPGLPEIQEGVDTCNKWETRLREKAPKGHQSPTKDTDCLYTNVFPKKKVFMVAPAGFWDTPADGGSDALGLETPAAWSLPQTPTFMRSIAKPPPGHSEPPTGCGHGLENSLGKLICAGLLVITEDKVRCLPVRENGSLREVQRPLHVTDEAQLALCRLPWNTESEAWVNLSCATS